MSASLPQLASLAKFASNFLNLFEAGAIEAICKRSNHIGRTDGEELLELVVRLYDFGFGAGKTGLPAIGTIPPIADDPALLGKAVEDGGHRGIGQFAIGIGENAIENFLDGCRAQLPDKLHNFSFEKAEGKLFG